MVTRRECDAESGPSNARAALPDLTAAGSEAELLARASEAARSLLGFATVRAELEALGERADGSAAHADDAVRDAAAADRVVVAGDSEETTVAVPLDDSRVLWFAGEPSDAGSDPDPALAELLGQTVAATLDRLAHADTLDDRESALERKDERFDRFAGLLAHELRNPVGIASGHLDLVVGLDADERHLDAARAAVDRMDRLTESLLDLIRGEPLSGNTGDVEVGYLARDVFDRVMPPNATLSTEGTITVRANERQLRTALERLFEEVVDRAGSSATVRVGPLAEGGFYVADDGPARERRVDADPFVYRPAREIDRRDLRLAIVRDVAVAHGWHVAAGSADGARFEFVPTGDDPDADADPDADCESPSI
ncbi:sensor histidine kinase [Halobellus sp. EA9]|uniref:sensor histidine kinase n=1 Tax=Halobellus sp. EA9 TaxID=3421647 RepID=UPI003EBD9DDB